MRWAILYNGFLSEQLYIRIFEIIIKDNKFTGFQGPACHSPQTTPLLQSCCNDGFGKLAHCPSSTILGTPLEITCSQQIFLVCVPLFPHVAEHFSHSLATHLGSQGISPHFWTSAGLLFASHRFGSTGSSDFLPAQETFLAWLPNHSKI